jgi:Icc protein
MRLVQITDLHIDPNDPEVGRPSLDKFRRIMASVIRCDPAAIIITGDLCLDQPRPDIYAAIAAELSAYQGAVHLIGGNHDSIPQLSEQFGLQARLKQGELYYAEHFADREVLFLDTHSGVVSPPQLTWLARKLQQQRDQLAVVFSHHPPLLAGVPFMDANYPLQNHAEVWQVLWESPRPLHLYCGHYHVERSIARQHLNVHITPSTSYQIDPREKEFSRDHGFPGYCVIDLLPDRIETTVRYLWDAAESTPD